MHRIRLREPWTASLNEDDTAIIYSRKFHRPTGADEQAVTLRVSLLAVDLPYRAKPVTVILNGSELSEVGKEAHSQPPGQPSFNPDNSMLFSLKELEPFNILEIRVTGSPPTIGTALPKFEAMVIPTFGSFVIESVELQIE